MSDTPRTDAAVKTHGFEHDGDECLDEPFADFARQLERELAAMETDRNDYHRMTLEVCGERDNALRELAAVTKERNAYAELAAGRCTIAKVTEELGQQTLCSSQRYREMVAITKLRNQATEAVLNK